MTLQKLNTRYSKVESCSMSLDDFKSLFLLLKDKVEEALDFEISKSQYLKQLQKDQLDNVIERIKNLFKLSVHIFGSKGEYLIGDEEAILDEKTFPHKIDRIIFDSSYYFKQTTNQEPMNKVVVQFDFKKQKIFNFSNPITEPATNESSITVSGLDDTWVNGVYAKMSLFLKERKKNRDLLHKKHVYDIFLYFIFYPIEFWCIYRVVNLLKVKVDIIFLIALCLYTFILLIYILRIIFNYIRWIFPLIEFMPKSGTKMGKHRLTLSVIALGIISSLIVDIVKSVF